MVIKKIFEILKIWKSTTNFLIKVTPKRIFCSSTLEAMIEVLCKKKHEFGLFIATNKLEAKNIAKSKWLIGCKKKHKDDIASLELLMSCDDCQQIKKIGNWEIELIPDNKFIEENNYPDWYGYQKIEGK